LSRQKTLLFSDNIQTESGAIASSYLVGTGVIPQDKKRPGSDIKYSAPSIVEARNEWSYTFSPPTCLHGVDRKAMWMEIQRTSFFGKFCGLLRNSTQICVVAPADVPAATALKAIKFTECKIESGSDT